MDGGIVVFVQELKWQERSVPGLTFVWELVKWRVEDNLQGQVSASLSFR